VVRNLFGQDVLLVATAQYGTLLGVLKVRRLASTNQPSRGHRVMARLLHLLS